MNVSQVGLNLVKKWEGFQAKAYLCPANVWTIGYGTTVWPNGKRVKKGDTITRDEASKLLEKQVNEHASTIATYVKVPLNQNQFDALASFQYNLGRHILKGTSLLNYLNNKQWDKAVNSMMKYNKARDKNKNLVVLKGLTNRRTEEVVLFKKPSIAITKGDDDLVFTSTELKEIFETRKVSPATAKLLDEAAVKYLGHTSKLKQGKLSDGDMTAISIELAVYFSKLIK